MTVWKPGMLAVCVDDRVVRLDVPQVLSKGAIYTVIGVTEDVCPVFGVGIGLHFAEIESTAVSGFFSERFRPIVSDEDDAGLTARIRACKPARLPILSGAHPSHAAGTSAGGLTRPFETAGILSQQLPQPRENSFHNISKALSVVHGSVCK